MSIAAFDNTPPSAAALPGRWADCRTVATTNLDLQSLQAGASVGGVTLVTGDRVLLAGQTAGAENGLWQIVAEGPSRPADFDAGADLAPGKVVRVAEGTRAGSQWGLATFGPYTLGTTALVFGPSAVAATLATGAYDNTAPTAAALGVGAFDNTSPTASAPGTAAYDNTAAAGALLPGYYADVRAVAETNLDLASLQAGSSLGGVTLVAGDRFLLAAQTETTQGGIWVAGTGVEPIRPLDFDQPEEIIVGKVVRVTSGTRAGTLWVLSTYPPLSYRAAPGGASSGIAAFDNGAAAEATLPVAAFANTAPTAAASGPGAYSNTPPEAIVFPGETAPVSGVQQPATPTVVAHTHVLAAGTNYLVQAGTRAAPVTIELPGAPTTGQYLIVADASGQAATHPVTVQAGALDLETVGTHSYVINRDNAVLELYWTGSKWKLL